MDADHAEQTERKTRAANQKPSSVSVRAAPKNKHFGRMFTGFLKKNRIYNTPQRSSSSRLVVGKNQLTPATMCWEKLFRRNERAGEIEDPRENPPTNGILRHDSQMRKSGVTCAGIEPGVDLVGGEQANRSATGYTAPGVRASFALIYSGSMPSLIRTYDDVLLDRFCACPRHSLPCRQYKYENRTVSSDERLRSHLNLQTDSPLRLLWPIPSPGLDPTGQGFGYDRITGEGGGGGGLVVRLLASQSGEPGSFAPGLDSRMLGIVLDDEVGRWGFPVSLRPCISTLLHTHFISPSSTLKTQCLSRPIISKPHSVTGAGYLREIEHVSPPREIRCPRSLQKLIRKGNLESEVQDSERYANDLSTETAEFFIGLSSVAFITASLTPVDVSAGGIKGRNEGRGDVAARAPPPPHTPRRTLFDYRRDRSRIIARRGIVPDDAAGRWVFSKISCFARPCIQALVHFHLVSPSSVPKISLRARIGYAMCKPLATALALTLDRHLEQCSPTSSPGASARACAFPCRLEHALESKYFETCWRIRSLRPPGAEPSRGRLVRRRCRMTAPCSLSGHLVLEGHPGGAWLAGWRHVVKVTYEGGEGSHRFVGGSGPATPKLADQQARPADVRRGARQIHPRRSEEWRSQKFLKGLATKGEEWLY
ncbi:hypothetical protein PR048_000444 [Dryococelus australis]|uniref:Uncharacterized protein n=1 Tax=Dryococelus australis TaxID=614101 RepID=A0ABQ9IFU8_9NEOP|nr:hypothetical protein PR048_000444 [Dryococelus australis]